MKNIIVRWFYKNGFLGSAPRVLLFIAFLGAIFSYFVLAGHTDGVAGGTWYYAVPILSLLGIFILDIFAPIISGILTLMGIPTWVFFVIQDLFGVAMWGGGAEVTPYIQFLLLEWLILFLGGILSIIWGIKLRREKLRILRYTQK